MQAGDHLVSPRQGYTHHGLYIGNDEVIHYAGYSSGEDTGRIIKTSLEHFTDGNPCQVVLHPIRIYDHEESVYRAWSRLGEAHYNALLNNCEHFATWCIQGFHYSAQVERLIAAGLAAKSLFNALPAPPHAPALNAIRSAIPESALLGTLAATASPTTAAAIASFVSTLTIGAAPLAVPLAVGTLSAYGAKKLFDWLTKD